MMSRTHIFAAVMLVISCLVGQSAWAQATNLEAGKTPSQLFAGTCNACHKSPRGLLKTVSPGSLPGFLREHYTTSGDMASQLATYLISNGASDSRQSKQGADKSGADKQGQGGNDQADRQGRKNRNAPAQEAARPEDTTPPGDGGRQGRRRQARPGDAPEEGRPAANAPGQADAERGPDGRRLSAKQRNRPGKPPGAEEPSMVNEPPKADSGTDDKAKGESRQEMGHAGTRPDAGTGPAEPTTSEPAKSEPAKSEPVKSEAAKTEPPKSDAAKDGASGDKPMVRGDPVPAVTSAVPAAASAPVAPAIASGAPSEPAASRPPTPSTPESPAVTAASAPPPAPSTGPPAAPMSQ